MINDITQTGQTLDCYYASEFYDQDFVTEMTDILLHLPMRYGVWSDAASYFIEEIVDAAHRSGLVLAKAHPHYDTPYMTDDVDRVAAFKALLPGWVIAVYDRDTGLIDEAVMPEVA